MLVDLDLISPRPTDGTMPALALGFSRAYLWTTCFCACPWWCWGEPAGAALSSLLTLAPLSVSSVALSGVMGLYTAHIAHRASHVPPRRADPIGLLCLLLLLRLFYAADVGHSVWWAVGIVGMPSPRGSRQWESVGVRGIVGRSVAPPPP
jgi:hypothetical protein